VPISDTGMATIGMTEARQVCRNSTTSLICCSSGVATVSLTTCAEAPG
jgi:hypothetical protein